MTVATIATRARDTLATLCVLGAATATVCAPPAPADSTIYPDTSHYEPVSSREIYRVVDRDGVWFTSPLGLLCGIKDDSSFGCTGPLPGVPGQFSEVAWFSGDPFPRLYSTPPAQFDSGAGQTILLGLTSIEYRGSRCSATRESGIYCIHGDDLNSQLFVTSSNVYRGLDAAPSS